MNDKQATIPYTHQNVADTTHIFKLFFMTTHTTFFLRKAKKQFNLTE